MASIAPGDATPAPRLNSSSAEPLTTAPKAPNKRPNQFSKDGRKTKAFKRGKQKPVKVGSMEEVLQAEIQALLAAQKRESGEEAAESDQLKPPLPDTGAEIEVSVAHLSSTGDGIAFQAGSSHPYIVSFAIPGDVAKVKVYRHVPADGYSVADLISITTPSPKRDDSLVKCQYFTRCSGCQFQMMSYADQLLHKRSIVANAYRNFSQLPPELVPSILDTVASPLQYGYRTKLTPHFDGPPGHLSRRRKGEKKFLEAMPEIGFMQKGSRKTLDIEDCPIGTPAVRAGMKRERERMKVEFGKYERGATILLRESTQRIPKSGIQEEVEATVAKAVEEAPAGAIVQETEEYTDVKTCITDQNGISTEYINDYVFQSRAGSFFQNNNSILPVLTDYIRQNLFPPQNTLANTKPIKHLIDAYSGSGLFTITLSSLFNSSTSPPSTTTNSPQQNPDQLQPQPQPTPTPTAASIGIDIDETAISSARTNATLNSLPSTQCTFMSADAAQLFQSVSSGSHDPDATVVVLDPPRKGCDESFLRQLLKFGPRRVVYVSCNVHTQARDVGVLVRGYYGGVGGGDGEGAGVGVGARYEIESLRGFDFFPQTGHVEGVAILNRVT